MGNESDIAKQLQKFGLSEEQADIYLLLVAHYELRIQEIAELAHIPRSSVYENLKKLQRLGLIEEVVAEHFKKIRAYPIGVLRHSLDEKISSLRDLSADLDDLEQAVIESTVVNDQPSTVLRYYRDRSGARQLYWNTLRAKGVVYAYSDWARRGYIGMKFYERFVTESQERSIQEKVLTNPTPQALDSIRRYNVPLTAYARTRLEMIRFLDQATMQVVGDTLMYDDTYAQVYVNNKEINGFEIQSRSFIQSQRSIFETLWAMATPASDLL